MSQYRDSFIGRGGGGGGGGGGGPGGPGRNRDESEEYMYREQEEDDGSQYSPETRYGFGAVPVPDSRSPNRPTQQPRRPLQPMSSRQDGNGGQNFPIPPVPRAPSNSNSNSNSSRGPPPQRPPRPSYVPSNLDSSEVQEVRQNPNFSYRLNQQPIRNQPRYSQQSEDDEEFLSPTGHPSMSSSRSIFIGFDPSNPQGPTAGSLGVIPNFPPVPPPTPPGPSRKSLGVGPPSSARRGTSSYYHPQALTVSPIPEEPVIPLDRHGSYASSAAIPTSWSTGPVGFYNRDDFIGDSDDDSEIHIDNYVGNEGGLVRHASLGRKSKPVITEIKSSGGLRGGSKSSSNESFKTNISVDGPVGVARSDSRSPATKSSTLSPSGGGPLPSIPQVRSPASSTYSAKSPAIQQPLAYTAENYIDERFIFPRSPSQSGSPGLEKELGYTSPWATTPTSMKFPVPAAGGLAGRRIPPRLNLDAVREAEARGSLTSLPDLIRRATKLAAVLETGRPDSRWGMRGSFMNSSSNSRSNRIDTDSISDILASFPPPALAQGKARPQSQWPLPGEFARETEFSIRPPRKGGRRLCGLPVWAFVLLVILALVVISAAIIVPLQLVSLYKNKNNNSDAKDLAECKQKNICLNGGETIAMKDFCGCVCTNGFTGSTCSEKADSSCTTVDLKGGDDVKGIQNVTMGNALPRLFEIAGPFYNIQLDMATVLAVFSNRSISCTAQNALVTFGGVSLPPTEAGADSAGDLPGLKKRQDIVIDTSGPSSVTTQATTTVAGSSNNRVPQLDADAVDFARVVVLYLTNFWTLTVAGDAQSALQSGFAAGRDFGNLSIGNNITVNFDNRSIKMSDGRVVGSVTTYPTTSSRKTKRSIAVTYLGRLLLLS